MRVETPGAQQRDSVPRRGAAARRITEPRGRAWRAASWTAWLAEAALELLFAMLHLA